MMENKQKYIGFIVVALVVILGAYLIWSGKVSAPSDTTNTEMKDTVDNSIPTSETDEKTSTPTVDNGETKPTTDNSALDLTKEQKDLLAKLQKTVDDRNFEEFAVVLQEVYKNEWSTKKEFTKAESELYVYATDTYWVKGDLENSLKVSTTVYNKVPEAWRFRYLRIVTLEKYGRNAFNSGDLKTAEGYANQILQMMFRPEGANLLADVYISKINTNIKDGNTTLAKQNLGFVWDYEASADRRTTLTDLKKQLGL